MSRLCIQVEGIAGGNVEDVVKELAELATRLGIWVECDVNGIHILAAAGDNPEVLWRNYGKAADRKATFVSANVIPRGP